MGIVRNLAKSYRDHDCLSLAANISFFAILSTIPLLMILTSAAGYLLGHSEDLFRQIISTVTDILPQGQDELVSSLDKIIAGKSRMGGIGIVALLLIASLLFSSIEHALDRIFQTVKKRNFLHSRLLSIILVFGIMSVIFLPTAITLFQGFLTKAGITIPLGYVATNKIFFVVLMILSFIAGVMIIPNHNVQLRFAIIGGVFFAAGIGIAKFIFRLYLAHSFGRYNIIYGSLAVLVVSVIWIYYLANILLISSELVAVLQRRYAENDKFPNSNVE